MTWRGVLAAAVAAMLALWTLPVAAQKSDRAVLEDAALSLRPGQYLWRDTGAGAVSIVVSLPLQAIYVFRGDTLIGLASVSTGKAGKRTPPGDFTILQKRVFHRSNLYSNAPMPYMQRLTWTGIALHAGVNPGYPASHGCIRLPNAFARLLFGVTELGVPVVVVNGEWSVPAPDTELPVIIAQADGLGGARYAQVTFSPSYAPVVTPSAPALRPAVNLRVNGDEWLVPETRLLPPDWR